MKKNFFSCEKTGGEYALSEADIANGGNVLLCGLTDEHKYFYASTLRMPLLYVTADSIAARNAEETISVLSGKKVAYLPAKDEVLFYKDALSKDNLYKRLVALDGIAGGAEVIVCELESLLQPVPLQIQSIELEKDGEYDLSELCDRLIRMGYRKGFRAETQGTFALRGDMLEIYPVKAENPVRIDFFGDTLEKFRPYDAETDERLAETDSLRIIAATDVYIEEEEREDICRTLREECKLVKGFEAWNQAQSIVEDICNRVSAGESFSGAGYILPIVRNHGTLLDLLPANCAILWDEPKRIRDRADALRKEFSERYKSLFAAGEVLPMSLGQMADFDELLKKSEKFASAALQNFASNSGFFRSTALYNLHSTPVTRYMNSFADVCRDMRQWLANQYRILCFCGSEDKAAKLSESLSTEMLPVQSLPQSIAELHKIAVSPEALSHGFVLHDLKLAVLGTGDLYLRSAPEKKLIRRKRGNMFIAPEIGDYVVHEVHGIGKLLGAKTIETLDGIKEYMAIQYRDGDMLYIPAEQMDTLSKYVGEDNPQLNRFGGVEFERVKERVRSSIKKMTFDLKKLYSERAQKKGFAFPDHAPLMEEFENSFEFEPTPDQLASIAEIKADMCSEKVMDRLVCGDVGYGKTEVALRAIYLCVLGGKQAAFMCPSTVLCEQHFRTCCKRLEDFGVNIAKLNRFCSEKEKEDALRGLKEGTVDLVVGTHRLLSKDVEFYDLGLLVLDEEQRFGVEHKEKIKLLRQNVDCLTLTATPIPRTLHMSLAGIRDISNINTPPVDRIPVQTYVVDESDVLIRDACIREISRKGQVFILYNRVATIETFASRIAQLVPEARITVGHGKMSKELLDSNVFGFYRGEYDILISTTIIENGIDLPNANTIIVIDSDRLGISQLYQLKGRVGRSSRLAYAYFTFQSDKVLTENAMQRLKAMMEFTELGAGFKLAMRDLEIRGAGDVLGRDQHGHMDKIGYELYSKMLKEALGEEEPSAPELDVLATAYIPDWYVPSSSARLDCYKQIAEIRGSADFKRVSESLQDTYGKLPEPVKTLLAVALLKSVARKFGVKKIRVTASGGILTFPSTAVFGEARFKAAMAKFPQNVTLTMVGGPGIEFTGSTNATSAIVRITKFLKFALSFEGIA